MFPTSLQIQIQSLVEAVGDSASLIKAREQLTKRYRAGEGGGFASSFEAIAYVVARLPATFAAVEAVLAHVPLNRISSVLDLGAGPGTAALAAALHWPDCQKFHLIEGDSFMRGVSQNLLKDLPETQHQTFSFQKENLLTVSVDSAFDLVFLSYVLNELSSHDQSLVLQKAWAAAGKGLVIIVPGTPAGYQQLMIVRDQLIESEAFIAAPCPHHLKCPLKDEDWCHFTTRLPRSALHQEIKDATLSYEDEKYSYLVALREPVLRTSARVIRKPLSRSGHVILDLCTADGTKRQTVSKRDKESFRAATKLVWGDDWEGH